MTEAEPRRRNTNWITSNANIYYRPRLEKKPSLAIERFPSPLIGPRRSRPQAIHIVSYPSGYVPRELREDIEARAQELQQQQRLQQQLEQQQAKKDKKDRAKANLRRARTRGESPPRNREERASTFPQVLGQIRDTFSLTQSSSSSSAPPQDTQAAQTERRGSRSSTSTGTSSSSSASDSDASAPAPGAAFSALTQSQSESSPAGRATRPTGESAGTSPSPPPAYDDIRPESRPQSQSQSQSQSQAQADSAAPDLTRPHTSATTTTTTTSTSPTIHPTRSNRSNSSPSDDTDTAMAAAVAMSQAYGHSNRSAFLSVRNPKSAVTTHIAEVPKPVASGSGVSCSIFLAEQNIFLSGFDHDGRRGRDANSGTALLRGKMQLRVTKNVKIKAVQLKLVGRARTEWPEGIPPLKQDVYEEESLRTQVLTFFNAMNDGWESEYGNQCTYQLKSGDSPTTSTASLGVSNLAMSSSNLAAHGGSPGFLSPNRNLTSREAKRLSLQNVQSRSFQKDSPVPSPTQAKGYKVFYPGLYDYSFELPIDHHQLETTKLQFGSVLWELHATVDRAGAFKPNLHGVREVPIIRVPDQLSLEMTEPISISRQWEDQLYYDIVISGKSFPIGSKIPIAFKLTPLAKVQVHKLKVFVTETIEYWTNDKRVTRKDPGRKILLLEKSAGKPLDDTWSSSELRTIRGGEPSTQERREARELAAQRRAMEASRRRTTVEPLPEPTDNLLGDLDLGLESYWGSTEIEANVQIPTCEMMAKNKELRLNPDCSWKNVNVYHWIKVVMRISRPDPEDPTGKKRRHFEISIDSPFTVLNCRATHANTNLPAYSGCNTQSTTYQSTCGCPDAFTVPTDTSPSSSTGALSGVNVSNDNLPAPPQAAHLAQEIGGEQSPGPRPMHLLRVPSFNPPAFDEDVAPPPAEDRHDHHDRTGVMSPPPQYDLVVGTPSVDGMADYFARLAESGFPGREDDSGSDSDESPPRILERTGRVNVAHPGTPGGRMPSRSMEISRPALQLDMDAVRRRRAAGAI